MSDQLLGSGLFRPSPVCRLYVRSINPTGSVSGAESAAAEEATVFHPAEQTRNQEWRQHDLSVVEAEAKREVGANCEESKQREDKV